MFDDENSSYDHNSPIIEIIQLSCLFKHPYEQRDRLEQIWTKSSKETHNFMKILRNPMKKLVGRIKLNITSLAAKDPIFFENILFLYLEIEASTKKLLHILSVAPPITLSAHPTSLDYKNFNIIIHMINIYKEYALMGLWAVF